MTITNLAENLENGYSEVPYFTTHIYAGQRERSPDYQNYAPELPTSGAIASVTQPQCNGRMSPWGNRLPDHGNPYDR